MSRSVKHVRVTTIDPDKIARELGDRIVRAREAAGITQAELGRRLGRPRGSVHRWENGDGGIRDVALLLQIAGVLACPLRRLIPLAA